MYRAGYSYIIYDAWYKMKMQDPSFKRMERLFPSFSGVSFSLWCVYLLGDSTVPGAEGYSPGE